MNKRSSLKILLDTSFLLPMIGFKTDQEIMDAIPLLRECDIFYSDLSILEVLWKIVKRIDSREKLEVVLRGIELIYRTFNRVELDRSAVEVAVRLYYEGHRDMIDNLLYGIALSRNLFFLTIDRTLRSFVESLGMPSIFISPRELRERIPGR